MKNQVITIFTKLIKIVPFVKFVRKFVREEKVTGT